MKSYNSDSTLSDYDKKFFTRENWDIVTNPSLMERFIAVSFYSLVGVVLMFSIALFLITILFRVTKKKHPSWLKIGFSFIFTWLCVILYLLFNGVAASDWYLLAFTISLISLFLFSFFDLKRTS
ncbi:MULTISPECIES: hypothetical protein [Yersinia]|uniref:Uncharacterized protein n=1 Tax=Yersinia aleksiciae TaxID=263819 RepID=A0A0T9UW51_YERAE|nr:MULTISPECIES: hypothetical protein [Yersinia]CNE22217.1 Uncharacterised protein [Yersinia intermedia]CNL76115.1 Uncharacterised protein [Yersinia aleksiciae]